MVSKPKHIASRLARSLLAAFLIGASCGEPLVASAGSLTHESESDSLGYYHCHEEGGEFHWHYAPAPTDATGRDDGLAADAPPLHDHTVLPSQATVAVAVATPLRNRIGSSAPCGQAGPQLAWRKKVDGPSPPRGPPA